MRKLDDVKAEREKTFWQIINIGLPIILVILIGFIISLLRKRKFVLEKPNLLSKAKLKS